jgi:hypothetical protein
MCKKGSVPYVGFYLGFPVMLNSDSRSLPSVKTPLVGEDPNTNQVVFSQEVI